MILVKRASMFVLLVSIALPAAVQTTQPSWPKQELKCEVSQKGVERNEHWDGMRPTHVAQMEITEPSLSYRRGPDFFRDTDVDGRKVPWIAAPVWKRLTDKQRSFITIAFMNREPGKVLAEDYYSVNISKTPVRQIEQRRMMYFFGMSEKDVCLMAEACVEVWNAEHRENLEECTRRLRRLQTEIRKADTDILFIESELKKVREKVDVLQKVFHYTNPDLAYAEFVELDKLVRVINIDIAGVSARSDAIRKLQKTKYPRVPGHVEEQNRIPDELDRLMVAQDIDLVGLLARKQAAETSRDRVRKYYDALMQVKTDEAKLAQTAHGKQFAQREKESMERSLADPPPELRPIHVIDNKIIIHPLK